MIYKASTLGNITGDMNLTEKALSTQVQVANNPPTREQLINEHIMHATRNLLVTLQRYDKTKPYSVAALKIAKRQLKECIDLF